MSAENKTGHDAQDGRSAVKTFELTHNEVVVITYALGRLRGLAMQSESSDLVVRCDRLAEKFCTSTQRRKGAER